MVWFSNQKAYPLRHVARKRIGSTPQFVGLTRA